jgi:hypothetical protein
LIKAYSIIRAEAVRQERIQVRSHGRNQPLFLRAQKHADRSHNPNAKFAGNAADWLVVEDYEARLQFDRQRNRFPFPRAERASFSLSEKEILEVRFARSVPDQSTNWSC